MHLAWKTAPEFDPDQSLPGEHAGAVDRPMLTGREGTCCAGACRMTPSARMIIELNIKHYRKLLNSETDASKRETIAKLLAEEEAKLARLLRQNNGDE
jgi:hypothetical protein